MKTKTEIQRKLEILCEKRLKNRYRKNFERNPKNCSNIQYYVNGNDRVVLLCGLQMNEQKLLLCDNEVCNKCKSFKLKKNQKEVKQEFMDDISNPSVCGQKEPKIAVLLWVLQEEKKQIEEKNLFKRIMSFMVRRKEDGSA